MKCLLQLCVHSPDTSHHHPATCHLPLTLRDTKQIKEKKKKKITSYVLKFAVRPPKGFNTLQSNCEDPWNDLSSGLNCQCTHSLEHWPFQTAIRRTFKRSRMVQNSHGRKKKLQRQKKKKNRFV